MKISIITLVFFLFACGIPDAQIKTHSDFKQLDSIVPDSILFKRRVDSIPETGFRFPLGDSVGHGYYITRKYMYHSQNLGIHLGTDMGDRPGSNADMGDTIYSISDGIVILAYPDEYLAVFYKYQGKIIKANYLHCDTIFCQSGDNVAKGQAIATIGNSRGAYFAHLHLEIMKDTALWYGGYGDTTGFLNPEKLLPYYKPY